MPANYTKWTNFWENLTPLDSSHLEVFLGIFWEFFIFLNSNLNFEFGPVWYRPKPEPDRFPTVRWTLVTTHNVGTEHISRGVPLLLSSSALAIASNSQEVHHILLICLSLTSLESGQQLVELQCWGRNTDLIPLSYSSSLSSPLAVSCCQSINFLMFPCAN